MSLRATWCRPNFPVPRVGEARTRAVFDINSGRRRFELDQPRALTRRVQSKPCSRLAEVSFMTQITDLLQRLLMMDAEPSIGIDDLTPVVTFIAVALIIGFAVVAAGWVIKRDV